MIVYVIEIQQSQLAYSQFVTTNTSERYVFYNDQPSVGTHTNMTYQMEIFGWN